MFLRSQKRAADPLEEQNGGESTAKKGRTRDRRESMDINTPDNKVCFVP